MSLYAVAGCRISIGSALDDQDEDFVAADFTGLTFTEIGQWTSMGEIGDAKTIITTSLINRARDLKQGGTRNAGTMENNFALDIADAGQLALIAAEKTNNNYAFKIEYNDKPAVGASPKNSVQYFIAIVATARQQGGEANTIRTLQSTLEINSNIVLVPASAT